MAEKTAHRTRASWSALPMFFDEPHRALGERCDRDLTDADVALHEPQRVVPRLAELKLLPLLVPTSQGGGAWGHGGAGVDVRALSIAREAIAYVSPLADSIFAVQGLGTYPLQLAGSAEQKQQLSAFASGAGIAAFALTEPEAGSDVAAIATRAAPTADGYRLDGDKLFISNLGLADHAVVVASTEPDLGARGLTAFWVPLDAAGVTVKPLVATAPHPIGALELRGVAVPASAKIGEVGQGMKLAMQTLDTFRVSVGAAAVGMARRALDEALAFVTRRVQFGKLLAEQPLIQATLADMQVDLDAARLLVLRATHRRDTTKDRVTTEVSIAKLGATEAAFRVIDRAVQLLGGRGVMQGAIAEHLYRAIRPLRIYEGTSEIQRTIIGKALVTPRLPR